MRIKFNVVSAGSLRPVSSLISRLSLGVLAAGVAGCALGPDYSTPEVEMPAAWQRTADAQIATAEKEDLSAWWQRLQDPLLSTLIDEALTGSLDLRTAQARLRQARALRAIAGADRFPTVTASAAASRAKGSEQTGSGRTNELYSVGFDARWEPDVFGGVGRGIEAAQADLEASEASLQNTRVSLIAEVALNYVEVRAFQARLANARKNLESQTETFQLTDWRAQAGLVATLDVEQARAQLEQTRAQIPALETGLAQAGHRLAVLLGRAPGALRERLAERRAVPVLPERVAIGIPADTLRQRPDVRAAERSLAAETARIGQAQAQRYPGFTLTGSIGLEALTASALGASGALAHSIAASVATVIFDGGRLRQQVEVQSAVAEQALVSYEAAILTALEDVENALVALGNSMQREAALRTAAEAARNAALLARQRYTSGLIDFQPVLDTERTLLSIEDNLAATQAESASSLIQLYKALGGGWRPL
jgi:NodT family efflux transporter outer membrane factor (OMF) lipoprotein